MKYIDAHCHILDMPDLIAAQHAGAAGFICNSATIDDWVRLQVASRRHSDIWPAFGIHPWHIDGLQAGWDNALTDVLQSNKTYMVGEIGLDKFKPDMPAQLNCFARQLVIAHNFGRVAHIHCVGAWGIMMDILRNNPLPPALVFHSYSGAPDLMPELCRMGAYFSFSPMVLDLRRRRMRDAVKFTPIDRMLVESDAPDSGAAPSDIPKIIFEIAKIRAKCDIQMADILYKNTQRILTHGQIS